MASTFSGIKKRLRDFYGGLTDREQMLLKVTGGVLSILAMILITLLFNQTLNSTRQKIDTYEKTLEQIADVAPEIRARKGNAQGEDKEQRFSPEELEKNDIKLTSFVATHATAAGVKVDSYDENKRPIGSDSEDDSGPSLEKIQLTVDINEAKFSKLMNLLERIELTDKPVVIERVRVTRRSRDQGTVRATIVVTTFKQKAKG